MCDGLFFDNNVELLVCSCCCVVYVCSQASQTVKGTRKRSLTVRIVRCVTVNVVSVCFTQVFTSAGTVPCRRQGLPWVRVVAFLPASSVAVV